jgi:hypothetical protein
MPVKLHDVSPRRPSPYVSCTVTKVNVMHNIRTVTHSGGLHVLEVCFGALGILGCNAGVNIYIYSYSL